MATLSSHDAAPPSARATRWVWTGRALTVLFAAFMLVASVAPKLMGANVAVETLVALGWRADRTLLIGLIELGCVGLYLWRPTAVLGAVLTTALLGGAMATQLRVDAPLFSHILFSLYLGLVMWAGLWLRDPALRAVYPWRRPVALP